MLLHAVEAGICGVDSEGHITFMNEAALTMMGFTEQEVRGCFLHHVVHHTKPDGNLCLKAGCPLCQAIQEGRYVKAGESVFRHKDGTSLPVEYTVTPLREKEEFLGVVLLFRNIQERKQAEAELKESEERYRLLVEHSPDTIAVHCEGRFVFINQAGARLFGVRSPKELIGRPLLEFVHPDTVERAEKRIKKSYRNKARIGRIEEKLIQVNGRIIDAEISTIPIMYNGKPATQIIIRDVTTRKEMERKLKEVNEKLRKLSMMDGLTGLANRRLFDERLYVEWEKAYQEETPLSLLLLDIDCFKMYNDTYGHLQGDECLRQVAQLFKNVVSGPGRLIARYGGEEFTILLPNTNRKEALACAEEICSNVAELHIPHKSSSVAPFVTVSIGVATMQVSKSIDYFQLVEQADQALYRAKQQGRNQAVLYEPDRF
jgi:diguanylate cyclase (GGDEF)-like protein/PAS domain S-box-containing protein